MANDTKYGYLISPAPQFLDTNGKPISGGKLKVYIAGTTIKATTYSDWNLTKNTWPVVLDSMGTCQVIVSSANLYKFVLESAEGEEPLVTRDNVAVAYANVDITGSGSEVVNSDGSVDVTATTDPDTGRTTYDVSVKDTVQDLEGLIEDETDRATAAEKAAKTEIVAGDNITVTKTVGADGQDVYTIDGEGGGSEGVYGVYSWIGGVWSKTSGDADITALTAGNYHYTLVVGYTVGTTSNTIATIDSSVGAVMHRATVDCSYAHSGWVEFSGDFYGTVLNPTLVFPTGISLYPAAYLFVHSTAQNALGSIKDWATSITSFRTGDVIPVDGPDGTAKMSKDDLLKVTAENALAGNVAPTFNPTKPNDDGYAYHVGELVTYNGKIYRFKKDKPSGAWSLDYVVQCVIGDILESCFGDASYTRNYAPNFSLDGYYNRTGSFISGGGWKSTNKLELSEIKQMTMQSELKSIKISGFDGGVEAVLANVAIWSVTNAFTSINIISSQEIQIPEDAKYIAFSTNANSVSLAKVYVTGNSLEMVLDTIRPGVFLKNTPYLSNYYCPNFADAVVGKYWAMRALTLNGYYLQKITLNKGDKIFIPAADAYPNPNIAAKIVGTDIFGYVLMADNISTGYTYTAVKDCIIYFPATSLGHTRCSVTKANTTDNIEGLSESVILLEKNKNEELQIVLPKYIDVPIGLRSDIFLDNAIGCEDNALTKPLIITGDSSIHTITKTHLYVEPTSGYGTKTITATAYDDYFLLKQNSSKVISFRGVSRGGGDGSEKNICICGDSLIAGGVAANEVYSLLGADGDFSINQIGTISSTINGNTVYHEGRSSWRFSTYLDPAHETTPYDGKTNAFMYNGELNFQHYMETNFPQKSGIDIFLVSLGTNDVNQGFWNVSDSAISNIVGRAKTFVDALLSEEKGFPNCKVVIGLPAVGAPFFPQADYSNDYFKMSILKLNKSLINSFDNGIYSQNVTCVPHGLFIDRKNSYRYIEEPVTEFTKVITRKYIDKVHPSDVGYRQWGRGYYGKIRAILNGNL